MYNSKTEKEYILIIISWCGIFHFIKFALKLFYFLLITITVFHFDCDKTNIWELVVIMKCLVEMEHYYVDEG